jgi:hypothetical protein
VDSLFYYDDFRFSLALSRIFLVNGVNGLALNVFFSWDAINLIGKTIAIYPILILDALSLDDLHLNDEGLFIFLLIYELISASSNNLNNPMNNHKIN